MRAESCIDKKKEGIVYTLWCAVYELSDMLLAMIDSLGDDNNFDDVHHILFNKLNPSILNFQQGMRTKTGPHPTQDFVRAATPILFKHRDHKPP